MSYATLTLTIIFALNLGLFLWTYGSAGGCDVCSPMLNITAGILKGDAGIDWSSKAMLGATGTVIVTALGVAAITLLVSKVLGGIAGGLTGTSSQANPLMVIALAFFIVFAAIPNLSAMGLPTVIDFVFRSILGFMAMLGVFGILRGE